MLTNKDKPFNNISDMKRIVKPLAIFILVVFNFIITTVAQPPPPPPAGSGLISPTDHDHALRETQGSPVGNADFLLITLAALYATRKLYQLRKTKEA